MQTHASKAQHMTTSDAQPRRGSTAYWQAQQRHFARHGRYAATV